MRTVIISIISFIFLMFTILGIYSISNNTIRENEVVSNTNTALQQALGNLKVDKAYPLSANDEESELIADFMQRLLYLTNSDSILTVSILAVDTNVGLLDVEVTSSYKTFWSNTKEFQYRKTILYDQSSLETGGTT